MPSRDRAVPELAPQTCRRFLLPSPHVEPADRPLTRDQQSTLLPHASLVAAALGNPERLRMAGLERLYERALIFPSIFTSGQEFDFKAAAHDIAQGWRQAMASLTSNVGYPAQPNTAGEMCGAPQVIRPSPANGHDFIKPLLPRGPYVRRKLVGFVAVKRVKAIKREE